MFSGVGLVVTILPIRNVAHFRIFRFRNDAGVANLRFFRFRAITANCSVGLYGTFFQATIHVRRIISFTRFAARCFGMKGFASVQFCAYLRRVREFQAIGVQDRFFAFHVLCFQRFKGGEGGVSRGFRWAAGARILASASARCQRRASYGRSFAGTFARFIFQGEILFRRLFR